MEATEAIQQQLQQLQEQQNQLIEIQRQQLELLQQLQTPSPQLITQSTRDLCLQARTLHQIGWSYLRIAQHLGLTYR